MTKMKLSFDAHGYLQPYKRITLSSEEFVGSFVKLFKKDSSRHRIFEHYKRYTEDFREKVTTNFKQWIDGSFVSNKKNPRDLDLVNLVDYETAEKCDSIIRSEFLKNTVIENHGIDAYLLIIYPENHKLHSWTKSDLLYWNDWFTRSSMNKHRKRYPKGYLEIDFRE